MNSFLVLVYLLRSLLITHPAVLPYYYITTTNIVKLPEEVFGQAGPGGRPARSKNAVWLEHQWFQDGVSVQEVQGLCRRLKENQIHYVYPHLSPLDVDGNLPPFSVNAARLFRKILREECPEIEILPWVGGVRVGYKQTRGGTVLLESDSYLQKFGNECVYLTEEMGFDGIHLNIEPVESGNGRFLEWLAYLKSRIGKEKILSVAADKPAFFEAFNLSPLRSWTMDYFVTTAGRTDQIVLMSYDTGLSSPFFYSLFVHEKIRTMLERFAKDRLSCKILLGVPTYDNAPPHFAEAENIPAALKGLNSVLRQKEIPKENFGGIALYGYWTTSNQEWLEFSNGWLRKTTESQSH